MEKIVALPAVHRIACLTCLLLCSALVGCNRGGEGGRPPEASIGGQSENASPADGVSGPAIKKPTVAPKHPLVLIETSLGNITIQLDGENSPLTVDNFLDYVDASHFDQTIIHQIYKGQGFVAGGYGTNLIEKPARTPIRNEAHNGLKNRRGSISMVRFPDAIDSATCQFFINVSDNPALDHKDRTPEGYGYSVFGEVVEGMEIVDQINDTPVQDTSDFERTPVKPIVINSIRRIR
ncbi:MAG: peptidylprolyl isomerase [Planctomycetes bacterium]|nr:peptidylprolyl isomerase [Planctomycetota bacterium]MBU4398771.1 peptidylprolyl isomerase [Planctomycetota bacterium]MCG2682440.1 peptidylprolyl isomerase [Planctomycetales bacterium]